MESVVDQTGRLDVVVQNAGHLYLGYVASRASDAEVTAAYSFLDPLVARNEAATASLMRPGIDRNPQVVADEIARVLGLPRGQKPFRSVVDFTVAGVATSWRSRT